MTYLESAVRAQLIEATLTVAACREKGAPRNVAAHWEGRVEALQRVLAMLAPTRPKKPALTVYVTSMKDAWENA